MYPIFVPRPEGGIPSDSVVVYCSNEELVLLSIVRMRSWFCCLISFEGFTRRFIRCIVCVLKFARGVVHVALFVFCGLAVEFFVLPCLCFKT